MAQKRREESEFKVSDKRLFTSDGELRDSADEQAPPQVAATATATAAPAASPSMAAVSTMPETAPTPAAPASESDIPEPPTASEQQAQHDAYKQSSRDLDTRVELSGHSAKELQMSFERFMASLYMTAMMQLGLMHEQGGQPGVDLIGARQTIDTLGMIAEKTKGNLTPKEQGFLQNCLYELRMAYVEVTNTLAHPPEAPGSITGTNG
jgi:TPR repeat protein